MPEAEVRAVAEFVAGSLKGFTRALNAALDSLEGIPGVGAIKELKDFVEKLIGE